jgi:hypothetical protein
VNVTTIYNPPADIDPRRSRALLVGVAGLVVCGIGLAINRDQFFRAWLIAYMLWLGVSLGSMALMMIHHLTGGSWGMVVRRVWEASSRTLPLMTLLFVPVLLGMRSLYPWMHAEAIQADPILRHKLPYLNPTFFIVRAAFYFIVWNVIAWTLSRWSREQDEGNVARTRSMQKLSAAGLVLYVITITFAAIDWTMSINPLYYSTIYGFLFLAGQGLSGLSFTIIVASFLSRRQPMAGVFKANHFQDYGKLTLAFVMLWAYFNFSQYLLVYAANIADEIPYFITRITNGWQYLAIFLVLFQFVVPFALLLSRPFKRTPDRLVLVAFWILFVRFADLYMLVTPEFDKSGPNLHAGVLAGEHVSMPFVNWLWLDLAAPIAIGGIWVWMFFTQLRQRPLLPVGDPYLASALESTGGH